MQSGLAPPDESWSVTFIIMFGLIMVVVFRLRQGGTFVNAMELAPNPAISTLLFCCQWCDLVQLQGSRAFTIVNTDIERTPNIKKVVTKSAIQKLSCKRGQNFHLQNFKLNHSEGDIKALLFQLSLQNFSVWIRSGLGLES